MQQMRVAILVGMILRVKSLNKQVTQIKVIPVTTKEYGLSKAARPFNSRLDKSKLVENGFKPLPTWQDAFKEIFGRISLILTIILEWRSYEKIFF